MNKGVWILQILAALAFTGAGAMKLAKSGAELRANPTMGWSTEFSDRDITMIGSAEVAGAAGLIVPAATGIAAVLTPAAGVALATLMSGAAVVHVRRGESPLVPVILGVLALTAGALRWRLQRRRDS